MTREARHLRCPEDVLGWIPWYADGNLSDRERGAVEAHASECSDCRAELDMIAGGPFEIDVELPDPDRAFAEILARISEEADRPSAQVLSMRSGKVDQAVEAAEGWARIADWVGAGKASGETPDLAKTGGREAEEGGRVALLGESDVPAGETRNRRDPFVRGSWAPPSAGWAAAAVAFVLFGALAGAMFTSAWDRFSAGDLYESATASPDGSSIPEVPPAPGFAMIDVVFKESATAGEIVSVLHSIGGEIVSGPSNLGVYRVRLSPDSLDSAGNGNSSAVDLDVALSRLKAQTEGVAIFAEVVP